MNLTTLQTAIENLSESDYNELSAWLKEQDAKRWDQQIAQDLDAGRFDTLITELKRAYDEGETTPV